jgi:catalase
MAKKPSSPKISTANAPISEKPAASAKSNPATTVTIHDQQLHRGEGGELHQFAEDGHPVLTTAQGGPIADDQNTLRVGARGPALIDDFHFREKIFHFDHERIPERVVHARGYGAHGFFETYESLAAYTRADLFQRPGEKTPVFVRFSTVAGNKGSADLARDVRGFAVKMYTKEGNWDLVGNNIPVFLYSGRHQVSRHHPRCQAGTRPGVSAGADGSR